MSEIRDIATAFMDGFVKYSAIGGCVAIIIALPFVKWKLRVTGSKVDTENKRVDHGTYRPERENK